MRPPAPGTVELSEFVEVDLADAESIDRAAAARWAARVDGLFNVAGVSSGIGNPLLVVTINFLGTRHFTEAMVPQAGAGLVGRLRVLAGRGELP